MVVSPVAVIGPFDFEPSRMGTVLQLLRDGRLPALVSSGYHWVDVRDVVDAALAAEVRGETGRRYLVSGEYASMRRGRRAGGQARGGAPAAVLLADVAGPDRGAVLASLEPADTAASLSTPASRWGRFGGIAT